MKNWSGVFALLAGCAGTSAATDSDTVSDLAFNDLVANLDLAPSGMVHVAAGVFGMGCNESVDNTCNADEKPFHMVTLRAFDIDRLLVTQSDIAACISAGACAAPIKDFDPSNKALLPANDVSFADAVAYCAWRNKRLPSEAEWEKAARGVDGRKFPWGNSPEPDCDHANFNSCGMALLPVGGRPLGASPYGVLDMAGQVWEWTADYYDSAYYAVSPSADPTGPATGTLRSKRGGSAWIGPDRVHTSSRWFHNPTAPDIDIGFRCALSS